MSEGAEIPQPEFIPDKFLNQKACDTLADIKGHVVPPESLKDLMQNLSGFEDYPNYILTVLHEIQNRFKLGITVEDISTFRGTKVDYDPIGLIGISFDSPHFNGVVIQPDEDGDNQRQLNVCVNGKWFNARPFAGSDVVFNIVEVESDSKTAEMMTRLGLPYKDGMTG